MGMRLGRLGDLDNRMGSIELCDMGSDNFLLPFLTLRIITSEKGVLLDEVMPSNLDLRLAGQPKLLQGRHIPRIRA
jgi:hypothetical protein